MKRSKALIVLQDVLDDHQVVLRSLNQCVYEMYIKQTQAKEAFKSGSTDKLEWFESDDLRLASYQQAEEAMENKIDALRYAIQKLDDE